MLRPKKAAASKKERKPPTPQESEIQEKIAQGRKRREEERLLQPTSERVRYPEDEEEEEEERKRKERAKCGKLSRGAFLFLLFASMIFISLPFSDEDYKGTVLVAVFNLCWAMFLHGDGWLDYFVYIASNALLAIYANRIVTEYHKVPGLLPPDQWAILLSSNGSILLAYWWFIIRKSPDEEREFHWNCVTMGLFALDCALGLYCGAITSDHLFLVLGRMRNFLLTGAM